MKIQSGIKLIDRLIAYYQIRKLTKMIDKLAISLNHNGSSLPQDKLDQLLDQYCDLYNLREIYRRF